MKSSWILLSFILFTSACTEAQRPDADVRLRQHFSIPVSATLDESTIRTFVLRSVPLGSTSADVQTAMLHAGIGADYPLSVYIPPSPPKLIDGVARIEFDRQTPAFVKTHYGLIFQFNADAKLTDVQVRRWLSG